MPRPEKFDRVKKLISFETGFFPVHIHETKLRMDIYFSEEDREKMDDAEVLEKLKYCIPKDTINLYSEGDM